MLPKQYLPLTYLCLAINSAFTLYCPPTISLINYSRADNPPHSFLEQNSSQIKMELKSIVESFWVKHRYFSLAVRSEIDLAHDSQIIVKKGQKLKIKYVAKTDSDMNDISNLITCRNITCAINPNFTIEESNGYEVKCFQAINIKTLCE